MNRFEEKKKRIYERKKVLVEKMVAAVKSGQYRPEDFPEWIELNKK